MGAATTLPKFLARRAGTVRRVVRLGDVHVCGLCRRQHGDETEAQACVDQCWQELLALDPVLVRRRPVGVALRCRFCARDYKLRTEAMQCAADCRAAKIERDELERELAEDDGEVPRKRYRPKAKRVAPPAPAPSKPKPVVKAPAPVKQVVAEPAPIAADAAPSPVPTPSPVAADFAPSAPAAAEAAGEEEAGDPKKKKKKTHGMFYRDGARYVCSNCNAKFFTKDEVVACFEAHK